MEMERHTTTKHSLAINTIPDKEEARKTDKTTYNA